MARIPMPSPNGTNYEQLYMNSARRELRAPVAAYDQAGRHPLARIARDNDRPPSADDCAQVIAAMLMNLAPEEADRLMEILREMGDMTVPEDVVEQYAGD